MGKDKEVDIVPSGSIPIDNSGVVNLDDIDAAGDGRDNATTDDKGDADKPGNVDDKGGDDKSGDKKDAKSKYADKTPEELIAILEENDRFKGQQSTEIGEMRKQLAELTSKLDKSGKDGDKDGKDKGAPEHPDYASQVADLKKALDNGEISLQQYTDGVAEIAVSRAQQAVMTTLQEKEATAQREKSESQFIEQYPDFVDVYKTGATAEVIKAMPILDHVSAYFMIKGREAQQKIDALTAEVDGLKKMQADALANGAKAADKVIKQPGNAGSATDTTVRKKGPFNDRAAGDSMLDAIKRQRGA